MVRALVRELIETILLALAVYIALQFSIQPYRVEGSSMTPGLTEGEYLLVNKMVYWDVPLIGGGDGYLVQPPRFGDVIVFQFPVDPTRKFVKRVIGVPGDTIEIESGLVYVNGEMLDEPYVTKPDVGHTREVVVPPDSYFVLGDNRRASDDSRSWGMVPRDNVIGRAWVSYWPPEQLKELLPFY
jgi:signal peptidase I